MRELLPFRLPASNRGSHSEAEVSNTEEVGNLEVFSCTGILTQSHHKEVGQFRMEAEL